MLHQHFAGVHHAHMALNTKTPARSKSRSENVMTGRKGNVGKTPFHKKHGSVNSKDAIQDVSIPVGKPASSVPTKSVLLQQVQPRPLVDKTPFPNRAAAATTKSNKSTIGVDSNLDKLPKLLEAIYPTAGGGNGTPKQGEKDETDELGIMNGERPSSMRKSARTPRLSFGSRRMEFKTPAVNGNPWDVSDGSIEVGEIEVKGEMREEVDTDEIEYMPPNTLDLPYQPPFEFDLPDYKHLGKTLFDLAHSCPVDEYSPAGLFVDPVFEVEKSNWETLKLIDDSKVKDDIDDPFYVHRVKLTKAKTKTAITRPGPVTRSVTRPRPASRTTTSTMPKTTTTATTAASPQRIPDMEIVEFSFEFSLI